MATLDFQKERKKQEKEETAEHNILLNDMKAVFSSDAGKRVLNHILGTCGIYNDNFAPDNSVYFNEGKRSVGLQLLDIVMEADPRIYISILEDNSNVR